MKKFFVLLVLVGGVAAAIYFYDPFLKPYLEPMVDKVAGKAPETSEPAESEAEDTETTPAAPAPSTPGPTQPAPANAAPAAPSKSEIDLLVEERYPIPEFVPLTQITDNWNNIPARAMPEQVTINVRVPFSIRDSSGKAIGSSIATPGTLVKPVRVQGSNLLVANLANPAMQSQVPLNQTDLKAQIEKRYNAFVFDYTNQIRQKRERAKQALMAKPETLAAIKKDRSSGGKFDAADDPRFAPVKASITKGDVSGFNIDEATAFRWNGSEKINGPVHKGTYDTVTVKYEARTIFGVFPGEAKCLMQSGRVMGWVDPITEEDLG